jgi:hypothetical protein
MTHDEALTLTERWLPLWTGNRPDELLTCYAADALYRDPAKPQGLRGHEALRRYFGKLLALNPDWRWEAVEVIPTAAGFTLKWQATIPVGDSELVEQGLDIVEVNAQGQITRNEVYFDRTAWFAAMMVMPAN